MIHYTGKYAFTIDAYLADFKGKATLPMIGNFMLQAATKHAEERGFGFSSMRSRNLTWVLSRMVIEICEYPHNEEPFIIKTWVGDVNKRFTERCFAFENKKGENIGYARSTWAAIDIDTRRPTNMLELDGLNAHITNEPCPIEQMKKIQPLDKCEQIAEITVKYSDIDINKHLNSMKYIEYFINLFDINFFIEKEIRRFAINYLKEIHYGTKLDAFIFNESENIYTMELRNADITTSSARIFWK
ncbi:MAG: acyl-[acyl-carrier-protein] thioesterase [Prevotellaceae bacterium]|jgi:acyl-ACP thioesterase|nr:acyl-[acyl-carrier-protein] thioesterase [Prevotellaceae bacterium]